MYLLREKSEVASVFKNFYSMIKTQNNENIKILHSDNGIEFFNNELNQYFLNNGLIHQSSCASTPQQNSV